MEWGRWTVGEAAAAAAVCQHYEQSFFIQYKSKDRWGRVPAGACPSHDDDEWCWALMHWLSLVSMHSYSLLSPFTITTAWSQRSPQDRQHWQHPVDPVHCALLLSVVGCRWQVLTRGKKLAGKLASLGVDRFPPFSSPPTYPNPPKNRLVCFS